jgi:protein tyrosine phosphatase (PTP) superfamily phosphohydrolase (DUF442 family)
MLLAEWNLDDALAVCRKEAREETLYEVLELLKQGYRAEQIEAELSARTVETKTTGK